MKGDKRMKTYKNETGKSIVFNGLTIADDENFESKVYIHKTGITLVEDDLQELVLLAENDTLAAGLTEEFTPDLENTTEVEIQVLVKEGNALLYFNADTTQEAIIPADSSFNIIMKTEEFFKVILEAVADCEYTINVFRKR